jgi:hypothetical protein
MIFALFNCLATSVKRLGGSTINVHKNYGYFYIGSTLISKNRRSNPQGMGKRGNIFFSMAS